MLQSIHKSHERTVMQEAKFGRKKREEKRQADIAATRLHHERLNDRETDALLADIANNGGITVEAVFEHRGPPVQDEERPVVFKMHPATWGALARKAVDNGFAVDEQNQYIWLPPAHKQ